MKVKKLVTAVAMAVPVGASLAGGAQTANAAEALPVHCSGDLCMRITYQKGTVATVYMWADSDTFFGHFELRMPNGRIANSPNNNQWYAGGAGYTFADWNGGVGLWCGTAWSLSSYFDVAYFSIGHVCLSA
jgi:hypothetical protein